jgi:hypothetical protein
VKQAADGSRLMLLPTQNSDSTFSNMQTAALGGE